VLALGACSDTPPTVPPDPSHAVGEGDPEALEVVQLAVPFVPASGPRPTLRDELSAMAGRVPGGFGGMYFDEDGRLTILLRDPARGQAARSALDREAFIAARRAGPQGQRFDPGAARIRAASHSYDQLHRWYDTLVAEMDVTPALSSIRVRENRIWIGMRNEAELPEVERARASAGVPESALMTEVVGEVQLTTLNSEHRPVTAGLQIEFLHPVQGPVPCTIGPNVRRLSQDGFLVNSHCTRMLHGVNWSDITHFWQHRRRAHEPSYRHIGNEAIDPPAFPCPQNHLGCRHSDAALGLYNGTTTSSIGRIARPASRNTGVMSLHPTQPTFAITGVQFWSIEGEILDQVGRTTGWKGGAVLDACTDVTYRDTFHNPIQPTIVCAMRIDMISWGGDSGGPVFQLAGATDVVLRGTSFGGSQCQRLHVNDIWRCENLLANHLGSIDAELNPDGNAPLSFFNPVPPPAGGGPGCQPNPFDPDNPICPEQLPSYE
jgi:hypothetical protein